MPLAPGANLGTYHVLEPIGSGTMGKVFRARDNRLQRDVALKVLPASVALTPERLARFVREAQLLASLNHPNIVTIHSVEEAEGVPFLTMELVQGKTLDRVIAAGPLTISLLLEVATAIADALVAAHAKGIVHRDLKPANVMLSDDGRIKVVDFGLATSCCRRDSAESSARPAELPRVDERATETPSSTESTVSIAARTRCGAAIGTPAYMSPEQVVGRSVDHRADLFAFGVILYELASGRRPFTAASPGELASAILHDTPAAITDLRSRSARRTCAAHRALPREGRAEPSPDRPGGPRGAARPDDTTQSGRRIPPRHRGASVRRLECAEGPGISLRRHGGRDHERALPGAGYPGGVADRGVQGSSRGAGASRHR